jgi:hypothetical protein
MTRLELPKGQWIEVRDRLNVGHTEDRIGYAAAGVSSDGEDFRWNMARYRTATAAIFILNWSEGVVDELGKPVGWAAGKSFKDRCTAVKRIDAVFFDHIAKALEAHERTSEEDVVTEKNETPAIATT